MNCVQCNCELSYTVENPFEQGDMPMCWDCGESMDDELYWELFEFYGWLTTPKH